jgi:hypothetical protein
MVDAEIQAAPVVRTFERVFPQPNAQERKEIKANINWK